MKKFFTLIAVALMAVNLPGFAQSNVETDPALPIVFNTWDANFLILKTGVKASDKFIFTCKPVDTEGWEWGPQVLPKSNGEGWADLGGALTPNAEGLATFTLTEDYANTINETGGLRVQGMGVKVLAVNFEEGSGTTPETPDGDTESIIDKFTGVWNSSETISKNDDGSITFNAVGWGGLAAWVSPADWSAYKKIVFEYAEPTTVNTQILIQRAVGGEIKAWGNVGITKLECLFEDEDMSAVNQVALQASDVSTIVVKAIYLVKKGGDDGIEEMASFKSDNAPAYNLAGVRVSKDYKGIVIQNGRKFIQK